MNDQTQNPVSHLRQEYELQKALYQAQPTMTRRFLELQARQLAEALIQRTTQARFTLPDRVAVEAAAQGEAKMDVVPANLREQVVGGLMDKINRADIRAALRQRLAELEQSPRRSIAQAAAILRYATAVELVHNMLPAGRSVTYTAPDDEEIPALPVADGFEPESAITEATDAIAEEGQTENGRGELLVPFVPAARKFYLPQWVAFDDQGRLLVNSVSEAEAHLASMQRFVMALHTAVALAPYMVADDEYQQKRYGMLGQLINQGRALANYFTDDIIATIKRRAAAHELNRGLNISLPYFDDQDLEMRIYQFEVIPAGRIMFVPAFVVRASREEQAKIAQDTRLSPSTRKYLLAGLAKLDAAFSAQ